MLFINLCIMCGGTGEVLSQYEDDPVIVKTCTYCKNGLYPIPAAEKMSTETLTLAMEAAVSAFERNFHE